MRSGVLGRKARLVLESCVNRSTRRNCILTMVLYVTGIRRKLVYAGNGLEQAKSSFGAGPAGIPNRVYNGGIWQSFWSSAFVQSVEDESDSGGDGGVEQRQRQPSGREVKGHDSDHRVVDLKHAEVRCSGELRSRAHPRGHEDRAVSWVRMARPWPGPPNPCTISIASQLLVYSATSNRIPIEHASDQRGLDHACTPAQWTSMPPASQRSPRRHTIYGTTASSSIRTSSDSRTGSSGSLVRPLRHPHRFHRQLSRPLSVVQCLTARAAL